MATQVLTVRRSEVRPGDELLHTDGSVYFRVVSVHRAVAKAFTILVGFEVRNGEVRGEKTQFSRYGSQVETVRREEV